MGLEVIHIKNYKCIQNYKINLKQMNLLLGENGSGKTNILSAIVYFYDNMISPKPSYEIFDENNPLNDEVKITLTYDLSKILMRSRKNRKEQHDTHLKYYKAIEGMSDNGRISLTLSQVKGGKITWNHDINKRKILYHLYPLYKLDAREINLVDWEELWEDIGDLIKLDSKKNETIHQNMVTAINSGGPQLQNRLNMLDDIFARLEIKPIKFSISEFSANMAKMYYNGKEFSFTDHKLDGFSNGTNSYNYISLMLYVLSAMGRSKMKEPILLMDEPEISLHFHMIDELIDEIFVCLNDMTILATTHAPRIVKNILVKEQDNCTIYQVYKRGDYSQLCLLNMFAKEEKREKYFLTEHHANAFFAKILILVEGETELELLQNPYLRILFPILKEAEIIKGMSDKVVYRIINTTTRHYNVPMVALLDMDKILEFDIADRKMTWKKEFQYFSSKENYYYGRKRIDTVQNKKRIQAMCQKCRFSFYLPFYCSEDPNYWDLIETVQEYYHNYHIYPVKTTTEGTLINENNFTMTINYLKEIGKWDSVADAFQKLYYERDKLNFLRLLFQGKSDYLITTKTIIKKNTNLYQEIKNPLNQHVARKTGWVSEWMEYYFTCTLGISEGKLTQRYFSQYCEDALKRNMLRNQFRLSFPELFQFIEFVTQLYSEEIS